MSKKTSHTKLDVPIHPTHVESLKKLNRVIGQLQGVKRMIEERRYCPDILTQTRAASAALKSLEIGIFERHLEHCVADAFESKNISETKQKIEELVNIAKRF